MGDVVDIRPHLRNCENCVYSRDDGICHCPGGWQWDSKYCYCATFVRRKGTVGHEKQ